MIKSLFIDTFNPKKLDNWVLPQRITSIFKDEVNDCCVPGHYLFYGSHGTGKSSLARYLISKYPHLYINASEQGNVDTLRNEVTSFCTTVQLNVEGNVPDVKVVMFDEIHGVSQKFFEALLGFMDVYGKRVRFIATTNFINKIPENIQSRFDCQNFNAESADEEKKLIERYRIRISAIISHLKMTIQPDGMDLIVKNNFPDYRGALKLLQRLHQQKIQNITIEELRAKTYSFKPLYDIILDGATPEKIHAMLGGEYATRSSDVLSALDEDFTNYILTSRSQFMQLIPDACIVVAKMQSKLHQVIDPSISMKSCVYQLTILAAKYRKN